MNAEIKRITDLIRRELPFIRDKYGVSELGIFGSRVRGDNVSDSDLDILVEFSRTVDYFEFLELEEYLSGVLGLPIDLVERQSLKQNIGKSILAQVVML